MENITIWDGQSVKDNEDKLVLNCDLNDLDLDSIKQCLTEGKDSLISNIEALVNVMRRVRLALTNGFRFCIVNGLQFEHFDDAKIRNRYILAISNILGIPTKTDQKSGSIVWDVKLDRSANVRNITYSQHNFYADLHTDTQYFENPEEVISLWCLNADSFGDGESLLADGRKVIEALTSGFTDFANLDLLKSFKFPFRVPSVFTVDAEDKCVEVFTGPIISETPLIRYRRETIDNARVISGYELSQEYLDILDRIDFILSDPRISHKFLLNRGEVVFINNHEILHGRTAFSDANRHLLRVRLNLK